MTRDELVSRIGKKVWYSQNVVTKITELVFEEIIEALSKGEKVSISGFGTFEPKKRAPRTGRNPHTDTPVPIPSRIMPVFNPGKKMKDAVVRRV